MKNQPILMITALLLLSCGGSNQKETVPTPPPIVQNLPGVKLETYLVTKMSASNYPQDRVPYIGDPVKTFHVYNKFSDIPEGSHTYEYALWPKGSSYSFEPKFNQASSGESEEVEYQFLTGSYSFNVQGANGQNVWSTIKTWEAVINNGNGEYYFDTYLDGTLINRIDVPIYSMEQIDSLGVHRYWLSDEYFNTINVGPELTKLDTWRHSDFSYLDGEVASIITPADYKGFKRFFAVHKVANTNDEYVLVEVKKQKHKEIRRIKTSNVEEVKFHLYQKGDEVYFYNYTKNFGTKYNLENGSSSPASVPEGISIPAKGVFPSGKDGLSVLKSCEDGAVYLVERGKRTKLVDLPCDQNMGWAGWSADGSKVYFDADGAFMYDVASGVLTQIFYDSQISEVNVFQVDNFDIIMFSAGGRLVKAGTDLSSVSGLGYWSNEFNYEHFYQKDFALLSTDPDTLNVDFNVQEPALSVSSGIDMMSYTTQIRQVGQVSSGDFNGYDLFRFDLRDDSECKGCEGNLYPKDFMVYFLSKAGSLVFLKSYIDTDQFFGKDFLQNGKVNIRDVGYALNRFDLFKQAKKVQVLPNTVIAGLISPDQLRVGEQMLYFHAKKFRFYGEVSEHFKLIGKSNYGDQVMVPNEEDGSFSIFHPDGSWSVYTYKFSEPLVSSESIDLENYVHFTDRRCDASPIDLSSVVELDKNLLTPIGTYSGSNIYMLNNKDTLQAKYQNYRDRVSEYGQMEDADIKSFQEFSTSLPFFYLEDKLGRFIQFMRKDYLSPIACEPILYVYPEKSTDVEISVDSKVQLIASYPDYKNGWHVKVEASGNFTDYKSQAKSHRIFWEGVSDFLPPLKTGFVMHRQEIAAFLNEKLSYLGLNNMEIEEFKEAWMEELEEKEYCFITFYDQAYIDRYAPIDISPKPDQFIRVLMDYKPLEVPYEVKEPTLKKAPERKGYVVVEWGGLKR